MNKRFLVVLAFLAGCRPGAEPPIRIEGRTMGTTYRIVYYPPEGDSIPDNRRLGTSVDSLLVALNRSVSTYDPASVISGINGPDTLAKADEHLVRVFLKAQEVSRKTEGAFDATVMPLVNLWGFGYRDTVRIDSTAIDSVMRFVGYRRVTLAEVNGQPYIRKEDPRTQIDFGGIAKGYGVDLVALLLERAGIERYLVEIGGEVRVGGEGATGPWRIGIEHPAGIHGDDDGMTTEEMGDHAFSGILNLKDRSAASSGNYRNYYYRAGRRISHEIDPHTGYSATGGMIGVTVVAGDCMTADAFATAFMIMGPRRTMAYLERDSTLAVYLIYADSAGTVKAASTPNMADLLSAPSTVLPE